MSSSRPHVAIVGAGISGLAAAILLHRAGFPVRVFERFDAARPVGSGLMIQPTGLAVMERLGLRGDLERRGHRIDRLHGATDRGRVIFDVAYADLDPGLHALGVHRAALHGVLWESFVTTGVPLETSATILATEAGAAGQASLVDERGRRHGRFDLVIDASGSQSRLRAAVSARRAHPFAYGAVWATIPDIGLAPARLDQRYRAARSMVGYLPVGTIGGEGPPLAALFWSLKPAEHAAWAGRYDAWRDEARALWPELAPVLAGLDGPERFTLAAYSHFMAPRFHAGRLALIGDSAHATSPQLGQGANHGLLDAVALADCLSEVGDIDAALHAYDGRRRRQLRFYQAASRLLTGFFQSDSRVLAATRDAAFPLMRHVPYLRREMVRTLAGLKTGLFSHATADAIARSDRRRG